MASRVQQDTFIDDSEETCPLCVEEFDLSDRGFRPCPCGYQFCCNNIRTNLNGLCPACRRPYDDKTIEYKVVSPEEAKADLQKQQRLKAERKRNDLQKREAENSNRKHLAGMRVVQKNLVYVVGLNPRIKEEDLLQTLRGDQYFGQYGKIIKIVVSKGKDGAHGSYGMGVYVTFARKEDAESCIAAVDGSQNGERTLRAQYGTTKYCSAYLRNEQCMNKSCMFLHEPGEENDSFTRQDLSSMNVNSNQRPPANPAPSAIAAATQALARQASKETRHEDNGESSALPTTASWATKGIATSQRSRRSSQAASGSSESPQVKASVQPVVQEITVSKKSPKKAQQQAQQQPKASPVSVSVEHAISSTPSPAPPELSTHPDAPLLQKVIRAVSNPSFKFVFSKAGMSKEDFEAIGLMPPLFDGNGCARRRMQREKDEAKRREIASALQSPDGSLGMASLQLATDDMSQDGRRPDGGLAAFAGLDTRDPLNPSRQNTQQYLSGINGVELALQQQRLAAKMGSSQTNAFLDQLPTQISGGPRYGSPSLQQQYQGGLFQGQAGQSHTRQASRYNFAGDNTSNKQQSQLSQQQLAAQHQHHLQMAAAAAASHGYSGGGMQGPPPGIKSAGTPPITGNNNGMLGIGAGRLPAGLGAAAGAGTGSVGSANSKDGANPDVLREILRARGSQNGSGIGNIGLGVGAPGSNPLDSKRMFVRF